MRYDIILDKYFNCWLCDYNLSMMQSWSLEPEAGCGIQLTFDAFFDVEKNPKNGSCWDWVRLTYQALEFGENINETFCGSTIQTTPHTSVEGGTMKVEFHSDSVKTRKGFMATWKSVDVATVAIPKNPITTVTTCTKGFSHKIKAIHV